MSDEIRRRSDDSPPFRSPRARRIQSPRDGKRITELAGAGAVCTACGLVLARPDGLKTHADVCPGKRRKAR